MATIASLPNLPVELISEILSYTTECRPKSYACKLYGIYALRLTCQTLYSKTFNYFTRVAFKLLFVDLTVECLDRLYSISRHAEIRKTVKRIYFNHDVQRPIRLGVANQQPDSPLKDQLNWLLREGFTKVFVGLPNLTSIVIVTLLVAIFSRGWQVQAEPSHFPESEREGIEYIKPSPFQFYADRCYITTNVLYSILMETIDESNTKLNSLEIFTSGFDHYPYGHIPHCFGICIHALAAQHKALANAHSLRLPLVQCETGEDFCAQHHYQDLIGQPEKELYRALNTLSEFRVLKLSIIDTLDDGRSHTRDAMVHRDKQRRRRIGRSLPMLSLPHLAVFVLSYAIVGENHLLQFYQKHSETLEKLAFDRVDMHGGTWISFCNYILDYRTAKLNELTFRSASDAERLLQVSQGRSQWETTFVHEGPDFVDSLR